MSRFVRFGRIILNPIYVQSLVRKNGSGHTLTTEVTLTNGLKHVFTDHAQAVWDYFKADANEGDEE